MQSLTKDYGSVRALSDVSLQLPRGEIGVLVGRSGSGKSTLMMAVAGWLRPTSGSVEIAGLADYRTSSWAETAHLPQRFGLLPELTIAENVTLPQRLGRKTITGQAERLLARLDLVALADRLPSEISVGQQQRAAMARALILQPRLLLADEPTSHQDARSASRVWDALRAVADEGTACLVATHDPGAADRADRAWEIHDGRLR